MAEYFSQLQNRQKLSRPTVTPWLTALMLILCVLFTYEALSHGIFGVKTGAFSLVKLSEAYARGMYLPIAMMVFGATFTQGNFWQALGNCYFLWVFGSMLEIRLGFSRYFFVVAVALIGGWALLAASFVFGLDVGLGSNNLFVGSGLLLAGIIGGYFNFFPEEKKVSPGGSISSKYQRLKIIEKDPASTFGISPWIILTAFVLFQVGMHYYLGTINVSFDKIVALDNMNAVSGLGCAVLGWLGCLIIINISTTKIMGHPLRKLTIQKYNELRVLDMTHDQALLGTANLMSIPIEKVKEWVTEGSGQLPKA